MEINSNVHELFLYKGNWKISSWFYNRKVFDNKLHRFLIRLSLAPKKYRDMDPPYHRDDEYSLFVGITTPERLVFTIDLFIVLLM